MLKLQVKEYCHECDSFIPKLDELDMYKNCKKIYIVDIIIRQDQLLNLQLVLGISWNQFFKKPQKNTPFT